MPFIHHLGDVLMGFLCHGCAFNKLLVTPSQVILGFIGKGYRVYFVKRGLEIILLLCGGDKSSQQNDIKIAKTMAKDL